MPEASPEQISNFLDSDFTVSQTPLTDEQVKQTLQKTELQTNRPFTATPNLNKPPSVIDATQEFIKRNQQGDIPLQVLGTGPTEATFGPLERFQVGRRRLMEDKSAYLKSQFGADNVRQSEDGHDFIIRVPDKDTGKPKDVLFNERKVTLSDLASIAGAAPEAAGGLIGMALGRGIPMVGGAKRIGSFLRDIISGSVGAETAGAIGDVEARAETGQPLNLQEAGLSRAQQIPVDVAGGIMFGGALKAGEKALGLTVNPLAWARTESQQAAATAVENIQQKTGINLLQTPGQSSGWPVLIQGEQYLRAHPASAAKMAAEDKIIAGRTQALSEYMTSGAGTDEEAGNALKSALQAQRDIVEGNVATAAGEVQKAATGGIAQEVRKTGTLAQPSPIATGETVRSGVLAKRNDILNQSRANYSDVYALPEANQPIIPTKPILDKLDQIEKQLMTKKVTKTTPTGVLGPTGTPVTTTTTTDELVKPLVPDELKRFIGMELDPEVSLSKMVAARDLLYDRISTGDPIQGIPTRYLKQIGNSMTESIEQGINALPTGDLKTRLVKANDFYKSKVVPLQEPGIGDLVAKATEPGFVESSKAAERLWQSPDLYKRTIEFVGPNSPTARSINRGLADSILRQSSTDGGISIDGQLLLNNLNSLSASKPDIFNAVFGNTAKGLIQNAKALKAASGTSDFKLSMQDALSFFEPGNKSQTLKALNDLASAQASREAELSNSILKEYTKSNFDPSKVSPNDFVSAFLDKGKPSEVVTVINRIRDLDPEIAQQIGRKTVEKVLSQANGSGAKLEKLLTDPDYSAKLPDVVGPGAMDLLNSFKDYLKNQDRYKEVAGGTGILTKGSAIGRLFRVVPGFEELTDLAKRKVAAYIISSPALRAMASAPYFSTEMKDFGRAVVTSVPFLKAAAEDFGNDVPGLTAFMQMSKGAAGLTGLTGSQPNNTQPVKAPANTQKIQQFLNQ